MINRRRMLSAAAAIAAAPLMMPRRAAAAEKRVIRFLTLANVVAIQIPGNVAAQEILPQLGDYTVEVRRLEQILAVTQALVAGGADLAVTDTTTIAAASAAGAALKIIGQFYAKVDLAFVVNADKIRSIADLARSDVLVGINATGDVTHALLLGIVAKHGVDASKVQMIGLGGSSARTRALLSGRVQSVPIHLDQADALAKEGNFKVLIKPWTEYDFWSNEVWAARSDWLANPANQRIAVDALKAQLRANVAANADFGWFADRFRKFASVKDAAKTPDAQIREEWALLRNEVKAWPVPMPLSKSDFNELVPIYEKAGIIRNKVSFDNIVDDTYLKQAQRELGI